MRLDNQHCTWYGANDGEGVNAGLLHSMHQAQTVNASRLHVPDMMSDTAELMAFNRMAW